ncbi:MAG: hypothetical protein R3F13_14485 [Prosthecobacter sp.]
MKALFITFLLFVSAFAVYDRLITPPGLRVFFENPPLELPEDEEPDARRQALDRSTAAPEMTEEFVPPTFETLESMTKNWTVFPPTAFPRLIKISKPVEMRIAGGGSTLPAGSTAYALAAQANVLLVAPTETSDARGQIFVHDTDLPTQVRASYEQWRRGRIEMALVAWKKRKANAASMTSLAGAVEPSGAPRRNADGSYDLLLASMSSGQVTDIDPDKIQRWGTPQARTIDNLSTWTVNVYYHSMTIFGPIDAEAQAQVRDGRIIRWIYPGSGEPVP